MAKRTLFRQIEVSMGQGKSVQIACREGGIFRTEFLSMAQGIQWTSG